MKDVLRSFEKQGLSNVAAMFESPVTAPGLIRTLEARAATFTFKGNPVPFEIVTGQSYDLGARRLNHQLFASVIDTTKTPALLDLVTKTLGYRAAPDNTAAAILSERTLSRGVSAKLGKPAWRYDDLVVVARVEKGHAVSHHFITLDSTVSIAVSVVDTRSMARLAKQVNRAASDTSDAIRGLGEALIAWDGKAWGTAAFAPDAEVTVGNLSYTTVNVGSFTPGDVGGALRFGVLGDHTGFGDPATGLLLPAPGDRPGRPGVRDWAMRAGQTVSTTAGGGGGGAAGGGGGSGQTASTFTYSGTGTCSVQYTSIDACFGCCDSLGSSFLAFGLTVTAAGAGTAAAAFAPSVVGAAVAGLTVLALGAVATVAISAHMTNECKDACANVATNPRSPGGGTSGYRPDGRPVA